MKPSGPDTSDMDMKTNATGDSDQEDSGTQTRPPTTRFRSEEMPGPRLSTAYLSLLHPGESAIRDQDVDPDSDYWPRRTLQQRRLRI